MSRKGAPTQAERPPANPPARRLFAKVLRQEASPLTPLHPALASGTVSALVEAWVRKPTYADFMALRDDVQSVRGWWRNRVARVLLNFFLTSLGTAIGVWLGGARMLGRLLG